MMRITGIAVAGMLLVGQAMGQDADSGVADIDATIDEVTVMGARSRLEMRAEIRLAEDRVITLFNDLNEDDDYDIICRKEAPIGSQIRKRVCLMRMYREIRTDAVEEDFGEFAAGRMPAAGKHQRILREKMRVLAAQHPELLEALQERRARVMELEAERERRRGD